MSSMKEIAIREYISRIDFKRDDWKLTQIKEDMRRFLGERPFLDVKWKKDVMLNEVSGEAKEIKALEKISVIFTDTDDKMKKIEIRID